MNAGIQLTPGDEIGAPRDVRIVLLDFTAEEKWLAESSSILRLDPRREDAGREWLRAWSGSPEGRRASAIWAARRLSSSPELVLAISPPLHQRYASLLEKNGKEEVSRACAEILGWIDRGSRTLCDAWGIYIQLAPVQEWPAVLVEGRSDLSAAMRLGDELAVLGLPVGLAVSQADWQSVLASSRWDRVTTRWRLAPVLGEGGVHSPGAVELPGEAARRYVRETAPEALPLLERASSLIVRERAKGEGALSGEARSAAEALLFSVLQARPFTHGRFALNFAAPFHFGPRAAEIDLAATSARLAVEVDGFYHFQNAEAYRRDRRKDALLQEHGWFVLRFLAEDIAGDLAKVVEQIECTLARRDLASVSS